MIAETFGISLDKLILRDKKMNKIEQTLINDGKRTRADKFNMVTTIIGSAFIILEIIFFLIPLGYLSSFVEIVIIITWVINSIRLALKERKNN